MARSTDPALPKFVRRAVRRPPTPAVDAVIAAWAARHGGAVDEATAALLRTLYEEELAALREGAGGRAAGARPRTVLLTAAAWSLAHLALGALLLGLSLLRCADQPRAECAAPAGDAFVVAVVQLLYGLLVGGVTFIYQPSFALGVFLGAAVVVVAVFTVLSF